MDKLLRELLQTMANANLDGRAAVYLVERERYESVARALAPDFCYVAIDGVPVLPYRLRGVWVVKEDLDFPTLHRLD